MSTKKKNTGKKWVGSFLIAVVVAIAAVYFPELMEEKKNRAAMA